MINSDRVVTFSDPTDPVNQGKLDHRIEQMLMEHASPTGATTSSYDLLQHRYSSLDSVVAHGNKEKEFLLKSKRRKFNRITTKILKEQQQQKLASLHYSAVHEYCLFVPSILLTLLSAVLAILVKSSLVPGDRAETWIAFSIAIISILSTFVQSLMKQLDLSGRSSSHESASANLSKLYHFLLLSKQEQSYNSIYNAIKTGRRLSAKNNLDRLDDLIDKDDTLEGDAEKNNTHRQSAAKERDHQSHDDATDSDASHLGSICSQFRLVTESCTSPIPVNISTAFDMIEARLTLVNTSMMRNKKQTKIDFSQILPTLYYQLTMTIIKSSRFPTRIPDAEWCVNKTFKDWNHQLRSSEDTSAYVLVSLLERADAINNLGETRPLLSPSNNYRDEMYV